MNYKHVLWLIHGTRQVNKKEEKVEVKSVTERERESFHACCPYSTQKLVGDNNGGP
jgi:hypothetical protein